MRRSRRAGGCRCAAGGSRMMPNMDALDAAVCASELSQLGGAATPSRAQAAAVKLWLRGVERARDAASGGRMREGEGGRGESER